jgi:hypothetical protein
MMKKLDWTLSTEYVYVVPRSNICTVQLFGTSATTAFADKDSDCVNGSPPLVDLATGVTVHVPYRLRTVSFAHRRRPTTSDRVLVVHVLTTRFMLRAATPTEKAPHLSEVSMLKRSIWLWRLTLSPNDWCSLVLCRESRLRERCC